MSMSEIERTDNGLAKSGQEQPKGERSDPTEWRPKDDSGWQRVSHNVEAQRVRSDPLIYQSLADKTPGDIAGIEAAARGSLIRTMEQHGLYPDERGIRVHWLLAVEGYGFRQPEGFIHPEAPDEVKREGRIAWKRCVEIASDSMTKFIFCMVWRKRPGAIEKTEPKALPGKED